MYGIYLSWLCTYMIILINLEPSYSILWYLLLVTLCGEFETRNSHYPDVFSLPHSMITLHP